jgi:hypothetical protein
VSSLITSEIPHVAMSLNEVSFSQYYLGSPINQQGIRLIVIPILRGWFLPLSTTMQEVSLSLLMVFTQTIHLINIITTILDATMDSFIQCGPALDGMKF